MSVPVAQAVEDVLIYGAEIDRFFKITSRTRREWIIRGLLPQPDGFVGGRSVWRKATYEKARDAILAGKRRALPQERL